MALTQLNHTGRTLSLSLQGIFWSNVFPRTRFPVDTLLKRDFCKACNALVDIQFVFSHGLRQVLHQKLPWVPWLHWIWPLLKGMGLKYVSRFICLQIYFHFIFNSLEEFICVKDCSIKHCTVAAFISPPPRKSWCFLFKDLVFRHCTLAATISPPPKRSWRVFSGV